MKKLLVLLLVIALCVPCFGAFDLSAAAASSNVYMIVTNPGENMDTQMNISFHANPGYTGCYVEYTKASDTSFASATKATGTQDADDYLWFYNRHTTTSNSSARFTTKFIHYNVYLTNLTPNTNYIYRVCDGTGGYSDTYAFKTAGQDKFSILWTSDVHITSNETTKSTRFEDTVKYTASLADYEIGLHFNTGDVVNSGERHTFWQKLYDNSSMKKYPWAFTTGNHDVYDSMMGGDSTYSQYWKGAEYMRATNNFPKNGYTQTSSRISGYLNADGYSQYIDYSSSQLFDPGTGSYAGKQITGAKEDLNGRAYWFLYNRVLFIVFDYYAMTASAEKTTAFNWANGVIEANKGKYDYLIASEHLNLFWGDSGTDRYYSDYQAWLDSANVDLFLCGDNHIYFRTGSLVNGKTNTDPEKGTYILQASAITNTGDRPSLSGPAGVGLNIYASKNFSGGAILNFDERGITLEAAVSSDGSAANFMLYETVNIPKKVRYNDISTGLYTTKSALAVKETFDASSTTLTTIPNGTVVEVNAASGVWGRVRYNGYTGWINLAGYSASYTTSNVTTPELFEISNVNVGYASAHMVDAYTPAYGSTIANGGWLFSGNVTITGVKDSTGAYKVTAQDTSGNAKNTTAIPANGCVLLINKSYANYSALMSALAVGKYFTLDSGKVMVYTANPGEAYVEPTIPGTEPPKPTEPTELVQASGTEYVINNDYLSKVGTATTAATLKAGFTNNDLRVTDAKGNAITDDAIIGTGYTISCYVDGTATDSVVVIIAFDVDGDGMVATSDYIAVGLSLKSLVTIKDAYKMAADNDGDEEISTADYITMKKKLKS